MACHPSGITVDVVGIAASDQGRSCEVHEACGSVLTADMLVRFRCVQIEVNGKEETALSVVRVSGAVDTCRVGFLRRHLLRYKDEYDGRLAQVIEVFSPESESPTDRAKHSRNVGCCRATLVELEYRESPMKRPRLEGLNTSNR